MRTLLRFIQKYSNFLFFLLLETVAVVLMVEGSSFQRSKIVGWNRQVSGFLYSKVDGAREYLSLKETNKLLLLENLELRNRLEVYRRMTDSAIVRRDFSDSVQFLYTPARVVNNSVYKQYNYITLDRGKKHGVYRNMGVVSDMGLVGIVLESSRNYSTVIPIINRDFRLSVKISSNDYSGILRWEGGSPLYATLSEIPFHVMLAEGDTILTSGYSSIFPEGIMVATIASFTLEQGNFYEIRVKLATQFQSLFHVNVIRNFRQEERLNLEAQSR